MAGAISDVPGAGDILFPETERQTVKVKPDKISRELNALRLSEIQDLLNASGGLRLFGQARPDLFGLGDSTQDIADTIIDAAMEPGLTTEEYLDRVFGAIGSVLSDVVSPQVQNRLSLAGLGRSGAVGEAVGQAATQLSLPVALSLPQVDIALRNANLARLQQAFSVSDIDRQLAVQDFMRQQGLVFGGVSGLPFNPGGTTTASTNKDLLSGILIPGVLGAAGQSGGFGGLFGAGGTQTGGSVTAAGAGGEAA